MKTKQGMVPQSAIYHTAKSSKSKDAIDAGGDSYISHCKRAASQRMPLMQVVTAYTTTNNPQNGIEPICMQHAMQDPRCYTLPVGASK